MKRICSLGLLAALALSACEKADPALQNAPSIDYAEISTAADSPATLQRLLTDTTHTIPMVGGNEYRYLGTDGFAAIKGPRDEKAVAGQWRILPAPRGGFDICIGQGVIADDINPADERCATNSEFKGNIFFPKRGDPLGLAAQAGRS